MIEVAIGPDTNLAWLSLWHLGELQIGRGGCQGQPGAVASTVEPGSLDLVVTGQRGVTIPPVQSGSGFPPHLILVGDGGRGDTGRVKEDTPPDRYHTEGTSLWEQLNTADSRQTTPLG